MSNIKTASRTQSQSFPIVKVDAFELGDGKAIQDTETGIIWLNFGVNNGESFNNVFNSLDTTFSDWRLPTESEVNNLWARLVSNSASDPYAVFRVWGGNKTPSDHQGFVSYGYFLDDEGFLSHASFIEVGTQVASPNPDHYYTDGSLAHEISTGEIEYDGSDSYPFNGEGNYEISTLLVKIN